MSSAQCENETSESQYHLYSHFALEYMTYFFRDFKSGRSGRLPVRPDRKLGYGYHLKNENRYIFRANVMLLI